jgi:AraC family transcriptional regulator of adaptative response/methylated-DNA-[protein]-cysteine methyltransferase
MTTLSRRAERTPTPLTSDEDRWQAVVQRDLAADGRFVYSVRTTGVYCRPGCPARRARREHVRFYPTCREAEQAGFRPCKRCRPTAESLAQRQAEVVAQACRCIAEADEAPSLDSLARAAGMSRSHFQRVFKAQTGLTPKRYAAADRALRFRDELTRRETVTEAIYAAGFHSSGRFYESSRGVLGMTPTTFRAGGVGTSIRFAIGACWLGSILVAATEQGICAILLGDDPEILVRDLQDCFRNAQFIGDDPAFADLIARVVGFLESPTIGLDLPLDVRGTAFQRRVWDALRAIPPGTTASYSEIAQRIGQPKSVRAVARACAANVLAVAIPCHRVVRTDGSLSGYRWGVQRKAQLLQHERDRGQGGDPEKGQ